METEHISTFLDVFDACGFATVAKARNVAPSTISRTIASLEQDLGVSLFDRTTRRLSPTQEGLEFERRMRPLLATLNDVIAEVREKQTEPSGHLKISASVSYGQAVIAPVLKPFHAAYPNIHVELILSDERINLVREKVDIAIRHGRLNDSSYIASRLADVRYHLVASGAYLEKAGFPKNFDDLAEHDLMSFNYSDFRNMWTFKTEKGVETDIPIKPVMTSSSALVLRHIALDDLGIAILPDWVVQGRDLKIVLPDYAVTGGHFDRAIWLMMPDRSYRSKRVVAFTEFLKACLK